MRGFTLVELVLVVCIIGLLLGMMVPALSGAMNYAGQVACGSNLHHIGAATQMYLKDNDGWFFPLVDMKAGQASGGKYWYFGFESQTSAAGAWGTRRVDYSKGKLAPYLGSDVSIGVCPGLRASSFSRTKYAEWNWTYGVNAELTGPVGATKTKNFASIRRTDIGRTAIFADSAQVNTWQAPASPGHPLIEEWFYIQTGSPLVHFRHNGLANVLFGDWHVEAVGPAPHSFSSLMPAAHVGSFDPEEVLLTPKG